ncbi:MAG TPA: hypothetical protein VF683_06670 [Chthoniobacterales bacterium]|jgi:hypothetical protein
MRANDLLKQDPWRFSTWQGARDHVLLLGLETTFREKLEWLEEAETLSLRFKEQRERQRDAAARDANTP